MYLPVFTENLLGNDITTSERVNTTYHGIPPVFKRTSSIPINNSNLVLPFDNSDKLATKCKPGMRTELYKTNRENTTIYKTIELRLGTVRGEIVKKKMQ